MVVSSCGRRRHPHGRFKVVEATVTTPVGDDNDDFP